MGVLATNLSRHVKENIGFSIVLNESAGERQVHQLQRMLERAEYVKAAQYISKEDALKEVMIELGENPEEVLGVNPLQSSIEVKLRADYANTDSLAMIEKELRKQVIVGDIMYQKDLIQSVNDNMSRIGLILLALAIVLMLISFALISNTIRLGAYSKRFLIHTMKLVGATPSFIRRPFIISNIINGIVASVIAMLLLSGCLYYLMSEMENFTTLLSVPMMLLVFLSVLVLGIILTAVSAYWAVSRYIRMDRDDLYYIKKQIEDMKAAYDKNNSGGNYSGGTSSFGFGWPVANHSIGTGYGAAGSWWSSGYHTGVDFPVGTGTPVYAVGDGQVFDTGYNSAYGNFVEIYHGNNVYSFYAHASRVNVSKGQKVTKGQQIMLSGATGNVSGPHLHFEIRSPGYGYSSCVNPMPNLP